MSFSNSPKTLVAVLGIVTIILLVAFIAIMSQPSKQNIEKILRSHDVMQPALLSQED